MAHIPLAQSRNEERLALMLETAQATNDFFHAQVVAAPDAQGQGLEAGHLATSQPHLFGARPEP
jgi:hypothetical protein